MSKLILIANPGSSSRKYALYDGNLDCLGAVHIEIVDDAIRGIIAIGSEQRDLPLKFNAIEESANHIVSLFQSENIMRSEDQIAAVGLRVVAPGGYFLHDRIINDDYLAQLTAAKEKAPLHIEIIEQEYYALQQKIGDGPIVGVSDSAFHIKKPVYAWNYGINITDADRHDIKRFGYHGLSVEGAISSLWDTGKLPPKVIVCHLGSGSSITGVYHGRTIDTSMGYSPLEGVVMATRSGTIDVAAALQLKKSLHLDDNELEQYLVKNGGLLGLGQSNDIRELIEREADGDHFAHLALSTLVHSIHKAIGSMMVALNGADAIVFTGTVGERSAILRKRIAAHLQFQDFILDGEANETCTNPTKQIIISQQSKSRPIFVIPANESLQIAKHVLNQIK